MTAAPLHPDAALLALAEAQAREQRRVMALLDRRLREREPAKARRVLVLEPELEFVI